MSDYSPPPGKTKTGKSLKAVRRYYALKAQRERESQRKRSPDEEKLSKRIARELNKQQEAIEKRSRRTNKPMPTGPDVALTVQNEGPVFVAEPLPSNVMPGAPHSPTTQVTNAGTEAEDSVRRGPESPAYRTRNDDNGGGGGGGGGNNAHPGTHMQSPNKSASSRKSLKSGAPYEATTTNQKSCVNLLLTASCAFIVFTIIGFSVYLLLRQRASPSGRRYRTATRLSIDIPDYEKDIPYGFDPVPRW